MCYDASVMQIYSPILLIIFHNPRNIWRSFEIIKKIKPLYLYIFAHDPREILKIVDKVDWPCKVETNISASHNDSPLSWFFGIVDEGIIIQDVCVPDASFIYFAQAMLERYRAKKEILIIDGYNATGNSKSKHSYFFSHIGVGGGWASWKRSWNSHKDKLSAVYEQGFQDWSHNNLMSIVPKNNLIDISPEEFGALVPQKSIPISFPLEHQILFNIETGYDKFLLENNNRPDTTS